MKYSDLHQIYWTLNKISVCLHHEYYLDDDGKVIDELYDRINWCIETIDEEMKSLERN